MHHPVPTFEAGCSKSPSVQYPSSHPVWRSCGHSIRTRLTNKFKLLIKCHPGTWSLPETPCIRGREHHCPTLGRLAARLWTPIGPRLLDVPVRSGYARALACLIDRTCYGGTFHIVVSEG